LTSTAKMQTTKRDREAKMFTALCKQHGYAFSDSLGPRHRTTIMWITKPDGKRVVEPWVGVQLLVPGDSALGKLVLEGRKSRKSLLPK
jgi:hypothetical protein